MLPIVNSDGEAWFLVDARESLDEIKEQLEGEYEEKQTRIESL